MTTAQSMTNQELRDLVASLSVAQAQTQALIHANAEAQAAALAKAEAAQAAALAKAEAAQTAALAKAEAAQTAALAKTEAAQAAAFARTEAAFARTEAAYAKIEAAHDKIAAEQAETSAEMKLTDIKIKKLAELYGGVSDSQGSAAEEFFFNSLNANPVIGGIKYDRVTPNLTVGKARKQSEFDMVLVNGNSIAIIEVKHKVHLSTLDQLNQQINAYRELFPEHANFKLYGGIAGLSVSKAIVNEAHKRGLFVLKQEGKVFAVDAKAMRAF